MRATFFLILCALLLGVFTKQTSAAEPHYVQIKKPFANIYEYLDPTSKIVRQAQKNDYFELVYEGTSWYQVKIQEKVGWLEKRAGSVVATKGVTVFSMPINSFIIFLLILLVTFAGTSFYIYRQKTAEL
jgi:hypothetical protein